MLAKRREAELPDLLTVEEAAALLRVGRTKAYAMAKEWRATGGRIGLPVVDFGNVLRVPLAALEARVGAELSRPPLVPPRPLAGLEVGTSEVAGAPGPGVSPANRRPQRSRGRAKVDPGQLSLLSPAQCTGTADHRPVNDASAPSRPVKA